MNRALQRSHRHRKACSARKVGGAFSQQDPLVQQPQPVVGSDWTFAVKAPLHNPISDCEFPVRPGSIDNNPHPELAQVAMVGGVRKTFRRNNRRKGSRKQRGGGTYGFGVDTTTSVGGSGPNVAPVYSGIPCDARAGSANPLANHAFGSDPRAPADLYSLTPNQSGGAYSTGNAYGAECYRAPGSQLPVYHAETAGFHFRPSTEFGSTLPDGVTAYNDVVPHAARVGGGRRTSRNRKQKKQKQSKKNRRSNSRKH